MTIDEMHIAFDLGFQKIASNQYDNFEEPQIDMVLNMAQERFVKLRMAPKSANQPGFADNQRRLDDLRELIVKNHKLVAIVPKVTSPYHEQDAVYVVLPRNYMFLVNDRSLVISRVESNCVHKPAKTTIPVYDTFVVIPFPASTKPECPFYTEVRLTTSTVFNGVEGAVTLFDVSQTTLRDGIEAGAEFELIRLILETTRSSSPGLNFYWEQYGDYYYPNSFIAVVNGTAAATYLSVSVEVDNVVSDEYFFQTEEQQVYKLEPTWTQDYRANRLTDPEQIYELVRHPFAKTRRNSPLSALAGNKLYLYEGANFIIGGAMIDYLRAPRRLSKRDRQNSELPPHTHQEIVDLAIEYAKLSIGAPDYQLKVGDNINRGE